MYTFSISRYIAKKEQMIFFSQYIKTFGPNAYVAGLIDLTDTSKMNNEYMNLSVEVDFFPRHRSL